MKIEKKVTGVYNNNETKTLSLLFKHYYNY